MRAVNLLPLDEARAARKGLRGPVVAAVAGVLLAAAAVGALTLNAVGKARASRAELQVLQVELAATPPVHAPAWQAHVERAEVRRTQVVADALAHRVGWERVVRELGAVLPDGVFLTRIDGEGPAAGAAGAAPTLELQGITTSHDAVADLLSRLAAVPDFTDVALQSSLGVARPAPPSVTFDVQVTLKSAEVAP